MKLLLQVITTAIAAAPALSYLQWVGVLDSEFTLKRLKRDKGKFYLQAENPEYPDLHALEELKVAGVVTGVIRRY